MGTIRCPVEGDRVPRRELYDRNVSRVRAAIAIRKPFHCETDDLLQDTFLKAFRHIRSFRGDADFATWITRIAINLCFEEGRRKTVDTVDASVLRDVAGTWAGPAEALDLKRIDAMVRQSIGELENPVREAVRLRFVHDCTYAEISRQLRAPVGSVKTWVFRGRRHLRRRLRGLFREFLGEGPC